MSDIKYLDLNGLAQYDSRIKAFSNAGDAAINARIDSLIGEDGTVSEQIQEAVDALKGTLAQDDAATLEAINDELDGIDSEISTLKGDVNTAGSVAKAVKDGIDAVGTGTAQGETGKAIVSLTQTNGVVTATSGNINAANVNVSWPTPAAGEDALSATSDAQAALIEIFNKIKTNKEAGAVKVFNASNEKVSQIKADGTTYTIKQGSDVVATVNIAADMVVNGGSVITATSADVAIDSNVVVGQKYIKLTLANSTDILYIPVNELYKDHTTEQNATKIQLNIDANNVISASVVTGSIEETDLTNALQAKINAAATTATAKTTGHVTLTFTPASGSTPANIEIGENDIASAQGLTNEVTRAKAAESEIAGKIGLTGEEGSKVYSTNVVLGDGVAKTVVNDINKLDARLTTAESTLASFTAITNEEIAALFPANNG